MNDERFFCPHLAVASHDRQGREELRRAEGVGLAAGETELAADGVRHLVVVPEPVAADRAPCALCRRARPGDARVPDLHTAHRTRIAAHPIAGCTHVVDTAEPDGGDWVLALAGEGDSHVHHLRARVRVGKQQLAAPAVARAWGGGGGGAAAGGLYAGRVVRVGRQRVLDDLGTAGKGSVLATEGSENTRQRQCLTWAVMAEHPIGTMKRSSVKVGETGQVEPAWHPPISLMSQTSSLM